MNKKLIGFILIITLGITGCIPFLGGNFVARDNRFGSSGGVHLLEMQQGITVKELYNAIKGAIRKHPKEFIIKGDDFGNKKSIVWVFSNKFERAVTFEAVKRNNNVYLGVNIGLNTNDEESMQKVYYLEDLVLDNLIKK